MAMTIQYGVPLVGSEMDEAYTSRFRWMIHLVVLADATESVRDAIEFNYHLSIRCAPFEALYERKCRSLVLWAEIGEGSLIGPDLVLEMTNKVVLIKGKLKATRDRQKSYADNRCKPLEFEIGEQVLLKVSPWKGVMRFRKKGKLAPRYVGPFEILERIGHVAYRLVEKIAIVVMGQYEGLKEDYGQFGTSGLLELVLTEDLRFSNFSHNKQPFQTSIAQALQHSRGFEWSLLAFPVCLWDGIPCLVTTAFRYILASLSKDQYP
ncbi:hypothetical protein Tco_0163290 [Tanacetum coccineum]